MKSIRTPLAEVRGLGSARKGTGEFVAQRVTSIALLPLTVALIGIIVWLNDKPYQTVYSALSSPVVSIVLIAAILVTVVHMRIGMQVIIEDYVHSEMSKVALLVLNWMFSWGVGLVAIFAVLRLALG